MKRFVTRPCHARKGPSLRRSPLPSTPRARTCRLRGNNAAKSPHGCSDSPCPSRFSGAGAGGGIRTRMVSRRILSAVRLPFRHSGGVGGDPGAQVYRSRLSAGAGHWQRTGDRCGADFVAASAGPRLEQSGELGRRKAQARWSSVEVRGGVARSEEGILRGGQPQAGAARPVWPLDGATPAAAGTREKADATARKPSSLPPRHPRCRLSSGLVSARTAAPMPTTNLRDRRGQWRFRGGLPAGRSVHRRRCPRPWDARR